MSSSAAKRWRHDFFSKSRDLEQKDWSQIGEAVIQLKWQVVSTKAPNSTWLGPQTNFGSSCSVSSHWGGFVIIRLFKRGSLTRKASPMIIVGANYRPIWSRTATERITYKIPHIMEKRARNNRHTKPFWAIEYNNESVAQFSSRRSFHQKSR